MNHLLKKAIERLCDEFKTFEAGRGLALTKAQHDDICTEIERNPWLSVIDAAYIVGIIK